MKKIHLHLMATIILCLLLVIPTASKAQNAHHKVVIQMVDNDAKVQNGLLKQLNNLKDGYGETLEI
jgi:hypothetical protein